MEEILKKLQATSFKGYEAKEKFILSKFKEGGQPFGVVVEKNNKSINTGNSWKFGFIPKSQLHDNTLKGKGMYWFFSGKVYARSRNKAREVYSLLQKFCESHDLGEAFAYKVISKQKSNGNND